MNRSESDLGLLCSDQAWFDNNGTPELRRIDRINKWAKYKPVRSSKLGILTDSDRAQVMWGFSVTPYTEFGTDPSTPNTFIHDLTSGLLGWFYLPPRGQSYSPKEWFRIRDFDGYNRNCICPIGDLVRDVPIDIYGNATISWEVADVAQITGNLTLSDLVVNGTPLTGYYLGLLLVNGNTYNIVTSDITIGSAMGPSVEAIDIHLTNATGLAGTWRAYPFFSSVQIPYGVPSSATIGVFFSAGWDSPFRDITFRLTSRSLQINAYGTWNEAHTQISIEWIAYNEDSHAKTVSPIVHLYYTTGNTFDDTHDEANVPLGQMTIPAKQNGGRLSGNTTLNYSGYNSNYVWWLLVEIPNYQDVQTPIQVEDYDDINPPLPPTA